MVLIWIGAVAGVIGAVYVARSFGLQQRLSRLTFKIEPQPLGVQPDKVSVTVRLRNTSPSNLNLPRIRVRLIRGLLLRRTVSEQTYGPLAPGAHTDVSFEFARPADADVDGKGNLVLTRGRHWLAIQVGWKNGEKISRFPPK